ncbi:hypothetical protein J3A83DRAFT_4231399 [Scleroderma citrinum]
MGCCSFRSPPHPQTQAWMSTRRQLSASTSAVGIAQEKVMAEHTAPLKRIKAKVERATADTGGTPLRKIAFRELIELAHSSHSPRQSKSYAAGQIPHFFSDFPDLEEEAINAVYDLCEDQDPRVRIDGYNAVTQVSYAQRKWVKRNADVLVQLLQSDEPEEVAVVKTALLKHLDMDPPVVLGVMCDQVVPPEDDLDESERQTRERLRFLVLSFLSSDALGVIVKKYANPPGSEAEQMLVSQLLLAIKRLEVRDAEFIVKDILLCLPCYRTNRSRGDEVLEVLLDRARIPLQTRTSNSQSLKTTCSFLALAQLVGAERRAASPAKLLRFYLSSLTGRMVLQKFSPEDRVNVISWIAATLLACEAEMPGLPHGSNQDQLQQLQRQVVDASSILLETLFDSKVYNSTLWQTVRSLLQAVNARKKRDDWTVPSHLVSAICKFQVVLDQGTQDDTTEIQNLIRSLVDRQPVSSRALPEKLRAKLPERPLHLPERPLANPALRTPDATQHAVRQSPMKDGVSKAPQDTNDNAITSPKRGSGSVEGTPEPKRARTSPRGQPVPSLLSRLADAESTAASAPDRAKRKRGKRSSRERSLEPDKYPTSGYSIKGAASAQWSGRSLEASKPTSLLGRINSLNSSTRAEDGGGRKR